MGAGRRQHHAAEEAKRQAAQEADRIRRMQEEADARMKALAEAMRPKELEQIQAPKAVRSTIDDMRIGVQTAKSRRKSVKNISTGISALRIPLNLGGTGEGNGLNIG